MSALRDKPLPRPPGRQSLTFRGSGRRVTLPPPAPGQPQAKCGFADRRFSGISYMPCQPSCPPFPSLGPSPTSSPAHPPYCPPYRIISAMPSRHCLPIIMTQRLLKSPRPTPKHMRFSRSPIFWNQLCHANPPAHCARAWAHVPLVSGAARRSGCRCTAFRRV